jgi:hypothetical protein
MRQLQLFDALLPSILVGAICLGVACGGPAAGTDITGSSAKPVDSAAPASSLAATPSPPPATTNAAIAGALDVPEKGSVAYTIDLPPGLANVSGDKLVASYAKSETDDAGPVVRLRPDTGPRITLDEALTDAKRRGVDVVKSEKMGGGWLVTTIDPKAKVVAVQRLVEGAPGIFCNAFSKGEGAVAEKERTLGVLESACRSVAIIKKGA